MNKPLTGPADFIKHDSDKPATGLIPPRAISRVAEVLAYGARKYAPNNWRKSPTVTRYPAAALRHVFAYMTGEDSDPETGLPHLAHASTCLLFQLELDELGRDSQTDDRIQ